MTTKEQIKTIFSTIITKINTNFSRLNSKILAVDNVPNAVNATNATRAVRDGGGNIIADTYATKAELQAVSDGMVRVVQQLPVSDISTSTFYLVPNSSGENNNVFNEYIAIYDSVNDSYSWELVGQKQIDLSGYYTSEQVHNLLSEIFSYPTVTEIGE